MTVGKEDENEASEVGKHAKEGGDVRTRLEKARVHQKWRMKVFQSRSVSKRTMLHVHWVMVMPVFLYGAETWAVTQ